MTREHLSAIDLHDGVAELWEQKYRQGRGFSRRALTFMEMLESPQLPHQQWLDAGCGTGTIARLLAQRGCEVSAVDGSAKMIEVTQRLMHEEQYVHAPRCLLIEDVASLPFVDASFHGVVCSSVLEYVQNPQQLLNELARVTRPGGRLLISVPNRRAWMRRMQKMTYRATGMLGMEPWPVYVGVSRHEYTPQAFGHLLAAHGFMPKAWRYFGPVAPLSNTRYGGTLLVVEAQRE